MALKGSVLSWKCVNLNNYSEEGSWHNVDDGKQWREYSHHTMINLFLEHEWVSLENVLEVNKVSHFLVDLIRPYKKVLEGHNKKYPLTQRRKIASYMT